MSIHFKRFFITLVLIATASFAVTEAAFAASTISTNISTGGTLSVTGISSFVGNVGIGTTTPWGKLSVTGGGTGAGIGFVFADSSNSPQMVIQDNGNVGIGTTSPSQLFSVAGKVYATGGIQFNDGSLQTAAAASASSGTAGQAAFYATNGTTVSGTSTLFIAPNQNVGIGTNSPSAPLEVKNNSGANAQILWLTKLQTGGGGAADQGGYLLFGGGASGNTVRGYLGFTQASGGTGTILTGAANDAIALRAEGPLYFGTGGDNIRMTILGNGNVGIGTTTPYTTLSVAGPVVGTYFTGSAVATSTFSGGIALTSGCFSVAGTCISSGGGSGITSLNGLSASSQTFATGSDTNLLLNVSSSGSLHTFTSSWSGVLSVSRGGTGISTSPTYGQLLLGQGGGTYAHVATSSLGLPTTSAANTWNGVQTFSSPLSVSNGTSTFVGGLAVSSGGFLVSGGGLRVAALAGCDTVDTDASGVLACGTDATSGGGGTVNSNTVTGQSAYYAAVGTAVSGTSTVFIDTNSRVGIGTTSPSATLAVQGSALVSGNLTLANSSTPIGGIVFGYCTITNSATIATSSSAYFNCTTSVSTSATHRVFVQATSSLPSTLFVQAASSTSAGVINLQIYNAGSPVAPGAISVNFFGIR
ncbi:MAG: hypothetical protein Q7S52_04645 [bacterium]|nr:hypothetical protein [bacterium]